MLLTYDFPHFKSMELLFRLILEGHRVEYAIGAPRRNLGLPTPTLRTELHYSGLVHPQKICKRFNIPYYVFDHNSKECFEFLKKNPVELGIVAGARILKDYIIDTFSLGILNLHPGYLPYVRGLDTLKWSIYLDQSIGITSHLIDKKIDAGRLILVRLLDLYPDDTLLDISHRMLEVQPDLLIESLRVLEKEGREGLKNLSSLDHSYYSSMPAKLEREIPKLFPAWLKKYAKKRH
jgi:phosphoribosylglycinamide formyltransferase-1